MNETAYKESSPKSQCQLCYTIAIATFASSQGNIALQRCRLSLLTKDLSAPKDRGAGPLGAC